MPTCSRWGRAGLAVLLLSVPVRLAAVEWRVLSEAADGARLRIEVLIPPPLRIEREVDGMSFTRFHLPEARSIGSPGAPELLELSRLLALPPDGEATLQVLEMDATDAGEVRLMPRPFEGVSYGPGGSPDDPSSGWAAEWRAFDARAYVLDGPRTLAAGLGTPGMLRHQRVVSVHVWPLLYDPATTRLRIVRRLLLDVRFGAARAGKVGVDAAALRLVTPRPWRQIYDQLLLNAPSAAGWLASPGPARRTGKPLASGLLRPGLLGEEEWKIRIGSTGPVRVPAAVLLDAGFPDGTPVDRLRLVLKRFDTLSPLEPSIVEVPLHVEDDGDGLFRRGDAFLFYGEHPRDDDTAGERAARFSFTNVYWLSVAESGTPARMPVRLPLVGALPGPTTFAQDLVIEEDHALNQWVFGDAEEMYFLLDVAVLGSEARWRVSLPGRAPSADVDICVDTQQDWLQRFFDVEAEFRSGRRVLLGSSNGVPPPYERPPPRIVVCGQVAAADIESGDLTVVLTARADSLREFEDKTPYVDNIRLRYTSEYRATDDRLRCTSGGASGPTAFAISGMSGQPVLVFDVTSAKTPALFDVSGSVVAGTLALTDDVPAGETRTYVVAPRNGIPSVGAPDVQRDTPDPILDELASLPFGSYDALVVAHDDFAQDAKLLEWKAFREAQGVRVRILRTSDAYDAFNGGLLHYEPIHALVQAAYRNWGIAYVLLVGDGSEDGAGLWPTSGPNLVPARMRYFAVRGSGGGGTEYRNDLYDRYYVKVDGGDAYPDLLIGRWPAGNAQELHNIVDKTLLYEKPAPGDDGRWRKRVLHFADDEWVRRLGQSGIDHRRGDSEFDFFFSVRCACSIVDGAFPGDLHCVPFYLHEWSNQLVDRGVPEHAACPLNFGPTPCEKGNPSACSLAPHRGPLEFVFYEGVRPGEVAGALADSVGDGVLFFAVQSHANRSTITDEYVIHREFDPARAFSPDFHNHGKPFVFFGFGCHLNEFGIPGENASGEALGELYLNVPARAAVASYASTGFEYLQANNRFHENMWTTIFEKRFQRGLGNVRVDPDTLEADWLLAALLQVAEISNGDIDIIDRFVLLGDPLLRLDAGVPRFQVVALENGFLLPDGRLGAIVSADSVRITVDVSDEQGIDSLWVEKRFRDRPALAIPAQITARVDTAAQVQAKRGYRLHFAVLFDSCDFDLVVGARDLAGRVSELRSPVQFDQRLFANGLEVESGSVVDARTSFRYVINSCVPDSTLGLVVLLDGVPVEGLTSSADSLRVTWTADFGWNVAPGTHELRFLIDGGDIQAVTLVVQGALGLHDVLAFPNPFADKTHFFFNLDTAITGGHVRIMDLNGRTVRHFDLGRAGTLQDLRPQPPAAGGGTSMAMNYVEWDGTDGAGDHVANGVYLYEVRITDASGQEIRKRDKVVVMR